MPEPPTPEVLRGVGANAEQAVASAAVVVVAVEAAAGVVVFAAVYRPVQLADLGYTLR